MTTSIPPCETCGADAEELCGKGCPAEATRGMTNSDSLQAKAPCAACGQQHETFGECMTRPDALQAAISALGAVEVAPGFYAKQHSEGPWYVMATHDLLCLVGQARFQDAPVQTVIMPAWWTPERRFAWKLIQGASCRDASDRRFKTKRESLEALQDIVPMIWWKDTWPKRIAADLTTGEEVPA